MKVVALSGSLRNNSINTGLIKAMQKLALPDMEIELLDYSDFPFYNQDINEKGFPASVEELGAKILDADAIIIATPEYNYSVPGVLKNAIDWLSRLPSAPFDSKPLAIVGASPSFMGTARAQIHLRQMLQYLNPTIINQPEVLVNNAFEKFDQQGVLTDEATETILTALLDVVKTKVAEKS